MSPDGEEELDSFLRLVATSRLPTKAIWSARSELPGSCGVAGMSAFVAPAVAMPLPVPVPASGVGASARSNAASAPKMIWSARSKLSGSDVESAAIVSRRATCCLS